jgi:hypothetical protein
MKDPLQHAQQWRLPSGRTVTLVSLRGASVVASYADDGDKVALRRDFLLKFGKPVVTTTPTAPGAIAA